MEQRFADEPLRSEWDLNPRYLLRGTLDFESSALGRAVRPLHEGRNSVGATPEVENQVSVPPCAHTYSRVGSLSQVVQPTQAVVLPSAKRTGRDSNPMHTTLVEMRGIEPLSITVLPDLLRAYPEMMKNSRHRHPVLFPCA